MRLLEKQQATASSIHRIDLGPGTNGPHGDRRELMRQLASRYNSWPYRCVNLNAQAAAAVPFKLFRARGRREIVDARGYFKIGNVARPSSKILRYLRGEDILQPSPYLRYKIAGDTEDMVEIKRHPFLDLMHKVNPWTDGFAFRESLYSDLGIFGTAYHLIVGSGQPTELWRLQPPLTRILPDPVNFVTGYEYADGSQKIIYPARDVLWYRTYDPLDPWGGIGPLQAWSRVADTAKVMEETRWQRFDKFGSPDYAILGETEPTEAQKRNIRGQFRQLFGRMWQRVANIWWISGRPVPTLERLQDTFQELEFSASTDQMRDMIGQAFGVPKSKLTTDDVNRSNARETKAMHVEDTIWTMVQRVEDLWNAQLLPLFGPELVVIHENPVPEDHEMRIQERASLLASGATVDEVRQQDGMDPLGTPEASEPMVASTIQPLTRAVNPPEPFPGLGGASGSQEGDEEETPPERSAGLLGDLERVKAVALVAETVSAGRVSRAAGVAQLRTLLAVGEAEAAAMLEPGELNALNFPGLPPDGLDLLPAGQSQARMWLDAYDLGKDGHLCCKQAAGERKPAKLTAELRKIIAAQILAVAAILERQGMSEALGALSDPKWSKMLADALRPALSRQIGLGLKAGAAGLPKPMVGFDVTNPKVTEFIEGYTIRLANSLAGTTRLAASRVIDTSLKQGASVRDIAQNLVDLDQTVSGYRAEMIARTESTRAYIAGQEVGWKESGVVVGKRWLLAPNACEFCEAVAAQYNDRPPVPIDGTFAELGTKIQGTKGGVLRIDYAPITGPPLHPHDRCDLVPVLE